MLQRWHSIAFIGWFHWRRLPFVTKAMCYLCIALMIANQDRFQSCKLDLVKLQYAQLILLFGGGRLYHQLWRCLRVFPLFMTCSNAPAHSQAFVHAAWSTELNDLAFSKTNYYHRLLNKSITPHSKWALHQDAALLSQVYQRQLCTRLGRSSA